MKYLWSETPLAYDGTQLRSLYTYMTHGLLGDSVLAWRGPCDISFEHMVDGEDVLAGAAICGSEMVHFLIEKFDEKLSYGVALQRILAGLVIDTLMAMSPVAPTLRREGDDVFCGEKKLSISIATVSPVSVLVHFAVNVRNEGTPVPTLALTDLQVSPEAFAQAVMGKLVAEVESIQQATQKVRWVK